MLARIAPRIAHVARIARRGIQTSSARLDAAKTPLGAPGALRLSFVTADNEQMTVGCRAGENVMEIAHANDIDLEGACEGSLACSTCHVIVAPEFYEKLAEPSDEENDMLDLAFGLTETSRLGCQIVMSKDLDGLQVQLPSMTRNVQSGKLGA